MRALPFIRNYSRGKAGPRFAALRSKILALLMRLTNRQKGILESFMARKFRSLPFKMVKRNVHISFEHLSRQNLLLGISHPMTVGSSLRSQQLNFGAMTVKDQNHSTLAALMMLDKRQVAPTPT